MSADEADEFERWEGRRDDSWSPTSIYQAFLDQDVLRYGPRHRLRITQHTEWGRDIEESGLPRKLPANVMDEAREWWEECARECD